MNLKFKYVYQINAEWFQFIVMFYQEVGAFSFWLIF